MVQTADKNEKIGLLGGTFDPVHNGHLAVAEHVRRTLGLDSIWFIPAALPPHKDRHADGQAISAFSHRISMLKQAIKGNSGFIISDIEAKRPSPSYSIDTINLLFSLLAKDTEFYFIIGADAFLEINTWKRYRELPTLMHFIVISRHAYDPDEVGKCIRKNFAGYTYYPSSRIWSSPSSRGCFILLHMEPVPISSTEVRAMVRDGKDINGLVPQAVADYIRKNRLYV